MTKFEFIERLKNRLSVLPQDEVDRTIAYFEEMIDAYMSEEGLNEEQAVSKLGSLDEVATNCLMDQPVTSLIKANIKNSQEHREDKAKNRSADGEKTQQHYNKSPEQGKKSNSGWVVWLLLFPLWLPLLFSILGVVIVPVFAVLGLGIALVAGIIGVVFGGIGLIISTISWIVSGVFSNGLIGIGVALIMFGLVKILVPVFGFAINLMKNIIKTVVMRIKQALVGKLGGNYGR